MICLYVVIFLFGSFCNIRCESQANFTDYPSDNVTTLEGGSLTFTCAVTGKYNRTSNRARMHVKWYLNNETSITTKETLSGGTMATVGSDYRSHLTLSNINRVWNGATVHCAVKIETEDHDQPEPFPIISVLSPPSAPHNITFEDVSPFSVNISWSPPSDNGGTEQPLNYSINITNNTVTLSFTTSEVTTLSLTNLQHSTQYGVEIVVENEYGVSPPAATTFTTPDSVPIVSEPTIIGAIVGVIVVVLLLILMILSIVLCYLRRRKNEMKKDNDDVHFTTESKQQPIESMYADVTRDRKSNTTREGILYADLKFPEEDQRRRKPPVEIQPVIYTEV